MTTRFSLIVLFLAAGGFADTLRMRDGSTIDGFFLGATQDDIRFSVHDEVQHFARVNVAEIILNPVDAAPAAPSAGPAPINSSEPAWVTKGPDYAGAPFLRGATGFISLEREVATASRGGGMYGMGAPVYRIQGQRSPVRVRQSNKVVFAVRFEGGGDPGQFQLVRLESRMGFRQTQATGNASLPVNVTKVSENVYEITPARGLYPGEYALSPANSNESYCFGVDY